MERGYVDSVIHVHQRKPSDSDKRLFHYQLATNPEEVNKGAKSRYYPIELSEMIGMIRNRPGKYVIVGIPCFIKSVRLLSKEDRIIGERVLFCIGLICGHLKSARFAELFSWQCGIPPAALTAIDFRTKLTGLGANQYGVTVTGLEHGKEVTKVSPPIQKMYGTGWGYGFFKYKACDYCDDVVAETADITIGDAWLPKYLGESRGTNVVIVRHPVIQSIIDEALRSQKLIMEELSPAEIVISQNAGYEHRRGGLAYRLHRADIRDDWRPPKRILANAGNGELNQKQELRIEMAELSHIAFNEAIAGNDFRIFPSIMKPVVKRYNLLYRKPFFERLLNKLVSLTSKFFIRR